jgi:hypothetical protein
MSATTLTLSQSNRRFSHAAGFAERSTTMSGAISLYSTTLDELESALANVAEVLAGKLWEIDEDDTILAILEVEEAQLQIDGQGGLVHSHAEAYLLELVKKGDIAQLHRIAEEIDEALEAQEEEDDEDEAEEADPDSQSE